MDRLEGVGVGVPRVGPEGTSTAVSTWAGGVTPVEQELSRLLDGLPVRATQRR